MIVYIAALCWWTHDDGHAKKEWHDISERCCPNPGQFSDVLNRNESHGPTFGLQPINISPEDKKTRKTLQENNDLPEHEATSSTVPVVALLCNTNYLPIGSMPGPWKGFLQKQKVKWFTFGSHSWYENKHWISSFLQVHVPLE